MYSHWRSTRRLNSLNLCIQPVYAHVSWSDFCNIYSKRPVFRGDFVGRFQSVILLIILCVPAFAGSSRAISSRTFTAKDWGISHLPQTAVTTRPSVYQSPNRYQSPNGRIPEKDPEAAEGRALYNEIQRVAQSAGPTLDPTTLDENLITKAKCVNFINFPKAKTGPFTNFPANSDVDVYSALVFNRAGNTPESVVYKMKADISRVSDFHVKAYVEKKMDPVSVPGSPFKGVNVKEKGLQFNCAPDRDNNWRRVCNRTVRAVWVTDPITGEAKKRYLIHETQENRYSLTGFGNIHNTQDIWCL